MEPTLNSKSSARTYTCETTTIGIDGFFIEVYAQNWNIERFTRYKIEHKSSENFESIMKTFKSNLKLIHDLKATPYTVRCFCKEYEGWLSSLRGNAISEACQQLYNENQNKKRKYQEELPSPIIRTTTEDELIPLFRMSTDEPLVERSTTDENSVLLLRKSTTNEGLLPLIMSQDVIAILVKMNIFQNQNISKDEHFPNWDNNLKNYLDKIFKSVTRHEFKQAIMDPITDDPNNMWRTYFEKILMDFMAIDGSFIESELSSAIIPFTFDGRTKFKGIIKLMSIFHNIILEQIALIKKLDLVDLNPIQDRLIKDVLKIPDGLLNHIR
ncbi:18597_t:CDS:2 [Gigaspora rosea]|nr:18597_t:CDS:2 [Gigaspora rosea]